MAGSIALVLTVSIVVSFTHDALGQFMLSGNPWDNSWAGRGNMWGGRDGGGGSHWGDEGWGDSGGWDDGGWGDSGDSEWGSSQWNEPQNFEPTAATCHVYDEYQNGLEVVIEDSKQHFPVNTWNLFNFNQAPIQQGGVDIHVRIKSATLEGKFTLVLTELATDYPVCEKADLGLIIEGQHSTPNPGFLGLMSRGRRRPRSAGMLRRVTLEKGEDEEISIENSRVFQSFPEARGRGFSICADVGDVTVGGGGWGIFHSQGKRRQVCEHPVLCCKLGLAVEQGNMEHDPHH